MWYLKYKYKHTDCIYVPKLEEYNLAVQFFHLGRYVKDDYVFTSSIQKLDGNQKEIKKYINYMQKHEDILKTEVLGEKTILTLAKHEKEIKLYESVYDSIFIHPSPAYLSEDSCEIHELVCWQREPLQEHIKILKTNKTTDYFEILSFTEKKLDDVYLMNVLPKLAPKQEEAIKLAFEQGYYEVPRKISLTDLAKLAKVSKPTFRENLKKAERKLIPKLISK